MFAFLKYKKQEAQTKRAIAQFMESGMTLRDAIMRHLAELNTTLGLGLSEPVLCFATDTIESLSKRTDVDNVVQIYATVLDRYVFRNGTQANPGRLDESRFSYAIEHLELTERGGYYVVKPDSLEDIELKYAVKK